jgi:protein tyrosine/serine phosphatase
MFWRARTLVIATLISLPMFGASAPGISNFDRVDGRVYRGGQPTDEGFRYLAQIGVKTVIDLQEDDSRARAERKTVTAAGMNYVNVPMTGLTPPTDADIVKILALLENPSTGAIFVHCHRGADRTGAVIAAYHIDHDKWDNRRALADAEAHRMSFFQTPRKNFIRAFRPLVDQTGSDEVVAAKPAGTAGFVSATVATAVPGQ